MKIYIAGPISGLDRSVAFASFARAEEDLADLGFEPINPMKANGLDAEGGLDADGTPYSWVDYMKADIPLLLACDAMYMLPGWQKSRGASLEFQIANALNIPVIHRPEVC